MSKTSTEEFPPVVIEQLANLTTFYDELGVLAAKHRALECRAFDYTQPFCPFCWMESHPEAQP